MKPDQRVSGLIAATKDLYAQVAALTSILRQLGVSEGQLRDAVAKARQDGDKHVPSGTLNSFSKAA